MDFYEQIYDILRKIPPGRVVSYGQLASWAGRARAARAAGYAMFRCPHRDLPCHRVVRFDGALAPDWAFGGPGGQRRRLEEEGVTFTEDGRVNMKRHRYRREEFERANPPRPLPPPRE